MEKKILIGLDQSVQALEAVDYAAGMAGAIPTVSFELVHIQPALSQYLTEEARRKPSARKALEKTMAANDTKARELLDSALQRMVRKGVAEDRIVKTTTPSNVGPADDILAMGAAKQVDAILVARSGSSYLKRMFMGSVTANLVENSKLIPVWMVDGTVKPTEVLLAADGSQSALRALDHLAFILSGRPEVNLRILHVLPRFGDYCQIEPEDDTATEDAEALIIDDDRECMDRFQGAAQSVAAKNGLPEKALQLEMVDAQRSVAHTIRKYAQDNGYGTLVIGRRGRSKSMFAGSVSRNLMQKSAEMALWVVP